MSKIMAVARYIGSSPPWGASDALGRAFIVASWILTLLGALLLWWGDSVSTSILLCGVGLAVNVLAKSNSRDNSDPETSEDNYASNGPINRLTRPIANWIDNLHERAIVETARQADEYAIKAEEAASNGNLPKAKMYRQRAARNNLDAQIWRSRKPPPQTPSDSDRTDKTRLGA